MRLNSGSFRELIRSRAARGRLRAPRSSTFLAGGIIAVLALLSSAAFFQGVAVGAALAPDILAPTIAGAAINVAAPGTESFWSQLSPLQVPLTATDSYGGTIPTASVKIASNGTHILMEVTYSSSHQDNSSVTTGAPLAPAADLGLFFANATIHRADQFVVWWAMTQNPGPPPCMQVPYGTNEHGGTSPASLAGTGNVWRWTASSTDSGGATFNTAKYGAGTGPLATHLINYTHSFATDMLLNTTGFYSLGQSSSNINSTVLYAPGTHVVYSPYIVYEKGIYNNTAHSYTQVIARPLTTTPSTAIAQFAPGVVYNFALAAFSGGPNPIPAGVPTPAGWTSMADTDMTKSISTWVTVEFSGQAPGASAVTTVTQTTSIISTTTATSVSTVTSPNGSNPSFQTATAATVVALVVGLIAGMIAVGRLEGRKKT
jgi:hypothetical protein